MSSLWGISTPGLTEALAGKVKLDEAMKSCEVDGNISLLPAGNPVANPIELINGPQFEEILRSLRERFDTILVDSPPILLAPDTLKVAPLLDGVLFVVQAERAPRRLVMRALRQMERGSVRVLGMILNRVTQRSSVYGSYYGSHYKTNNK